MPFNVNALEAAQLSRLAYWPKKDLEFLQSEYDKDPLRLRPDLEEFRALLPKGWRVAVPLSDYGSYAADKIDPHNQVIAFINEETRQGVLAFKGSSNVQNFGSDFRNDGGSEWLHMRDNVRNILQLKDELYVRDRLRQDPDYQPYTWSVTGHSLGGGLAQTCAVLHGMSGHVQNPLPVSRKAIDTECWDGRTTGEESFQRALLDWKRHNHKLTETLVEGDIAHRFYHDLKQGIFVHTNRVILPHAGPPGFSTAPIRTALSYTPVGPFCEAVDAHMGATVTQAIQHVERESGRPLRAPERQSTYLDKIAPRNVMVSPQTGQSTRGVISPGPVGHVQDIGIQMWKTRSSTRAQYYAAAPSQHSYVHGHRSNTGPAPRRTSTSVLDEVPEVRTHVARKMH